MAAAPRRACCTARCPRAGRRTPGGAGLVSRLRRERAGSRPARADARTGPALGSAACPARGGSRRLCVVPAHRAWRPDPARATGAAWQWIDAHLAPDATVAAVGFSQGGLMATQLLRTLPERIAATVVLSGFVQAAPQLADERLAARRPAVFWGRGARGPYDPRRCDRGDTAVAGRPSALPRRLPRSRARHPQPGNRRRPCLPQRPDRRQSNPLTARARPLMRAAGGSDLRQSGVVTTQSL